MNIPGTISGSPFFGPLQGGLFFFNNILLRGQNSISPLISAMPFRHCWTIKIEHNEELIEGVVYSKWEDGHAMAARLDKNGKLFFPFRRHPIENWRALPAEAQSYGDANAGLRQIIKQTIETFDEQLKQDVHAQLQVFFKFVFFFNIRLYSIRTEYV